MPRIYLWQKAPTIRLLIALITGIIVQWYVQLQPLVIIIFALSGLCFLLIYRLLTISKKYLFAWLNGTGLIFLFIALGAFLTYNKNITNNKSWFGKYYTDGDFVVATLQEPLVEKANSYKADATVSYIIKGKELKPVKGTIIIYFKKDTSYKTLGYGSELVIKAPLQEIKNGGNPGSFDYKRYSLFQGITHQVFLNTTGFETTGNKNENFLDAFLVKSRLAILNILRTFITSPKEQGLAEALLIGYKDDLDKKLVESYSKTGVVHVIAISGLHLGIIYGILMWLTYPLKRKKLAIARFVIIVVGLWMFSLLAGAQPSVLRSALMFTIIAWGALLFRRTSVYNTLAFSALILLIINPFWLWDVGFQLSYAAVLSIIIFYRPLYILIGTQNKILDFFCKLIAVSVAAQILTMPLSILHFHQFPVFFIITNLVAVPLSSLILIGEIILCSIFFITPVAKALGKLLETLIRWMNNFIEYFEEVPFAVWDGLSITVIQTIILYIFIACVGYWLLQNNKRALILSTLFILLFFVLRAISFYHANHQKKLVVYNVPKIQAIDLINGREYIFIGDEQLLKNDFLQNFHLKPSRILHRIELKENRKNIKSLQFFDKKILVIDTSFKLKKLHLKDDVDVLVLSKNPKVYISQLTQAFNIKQIVIDGSVPQWKAKLWKKDCDSLKINCFDVSEKGAFVMNL